MSIQRKQFEELMEPCCRKVSIGKISARQFELPIVFFYKETNGAQSGKVEKFRKNPICRVIRMVSRILGLQPHPNGKRAT